MWDSVKDNIFHFSVPLERLVPWMYCDSLGKVTIGVGNLIDSEAAALGLSNQGALLFHKEPPGVPLTRPASESEIRTEWHKVKDSGAGASATEGLTDLRLSEDGINELVSRRVAEMELYLTDGHVAAFSNFPNWPIPALVAWRLAHSWPLTQTFAGYGK